VLGTLPRETSQCRRIAVDRGDLLTLYADGATEVFSCSGTVYEADRLREVTAGSDDSEQGLEGALVNDVVQHLQRADQSGVLALIAVACLWRQRQLID
jgi:serine phosphatase RsbU (regulator of sigma subunit)